MNIAVRVMKTNNLPCGDPLAESGDGEESIGTGIHTKKETKGKIKLKSFNLRRNQKDKSESKFECG